MKKNVAISILISRNIFPYSDHNRSFPALPNTAISVEDLERNLVSEPKLPQPAKQQPPQQVCCFTFTKFSNKIIQANF